ncbi:hypothetical protein HHX48_06155 [Salinimonas sp. HHU 13199]|uniref:Uncharacterized protein n=1 Tax=Salinimonas profundi TaxID=2729140 RepID=A0ABR8LHT9_9ALTE|nr:hypothetical protein [Salinimonas profundi]MBD3585307.1 hypothetical protein [Salinimonas profundi]
MLLEVTLAIFSAASALLGVLTLTSSDGGREWWKKTASIAKLLALNILIVLSLGVVKTYFDKIQDDKNEAHLSTLEKSLESSLSKQHDLKSQLTNAEIKLRNVIENANKKELQYHQLKDRQHKDGWISAFKAERDINLRILKFLSSELNSDNQLGFLYRPSYLKINYLGNLIKTPHTQNQQQLQMMTLLYEELSEINGKIKAGSNAVQLGNHNQMMSGISRFFGVEDNTRNALNLYQAISIQF